MTKYLNSGVTIPFSVKSGIRMIMIFPVIKLIKYIYTVKDGRGLPCS